MDLIIDFFKLGFLIISYRRRFCFFSLHHLFFRFLETTSTSPNSLKTSINTKGYSDRNFGNIIKILSEKLRVVRNPFIASSARIFKKKFRTFWSKINIKTFYLTPTQITILMKVLVNLHPSI